jgi:hypothetical protein
LGPPSIGPAADSSDPTTAKRQQHSDREKRLAGALRENLRRRKQQARARRQKAGSPATESPTGDPPA